MSFSILVALVIVALAIVALAIIAWWYFPVWQRRRQEVQLTPGSRLTAKDLAELENEYRKTCSQILGSIVLFLTVVVAYMQLIQTQSNSENQISQTAQKTDLDNSNLRLAKGFELIGATSAAQRAGGIHLLMQWAERAKDNERNGRLDIVAKTLINMVRDKSPLGKGPPFSSESCEKFDNADRPVGSMVASDIQQALDELVKISGRITVSINFYGVNLSRAKLANGKFNEANFAFADLSGVDFTGTELRNSDFYCSRMFRAKFPGADLSGTSLSERNRQTNMAGALLSEAYFSNGNKPASLKGVNLVSAVLDRAVIESVDMSGANLDNAKLVKTRLVRVNLDGAIVDNACLIDPVMVETTLENAKGVNLLVVVSTNVEMLETILKSARGANSPAVVSTAEDLSRESPCWNHLNRPLPQ